jgi:tetratricopeptide (TPR) repeat protein
VTGKRLLTALAIALSCVAPQAAAQDVAAQEAPQEAVAAPAADAAPPADALLPDAAPIEDTPALDPTLDPAEPPIAPGAIPIEPAPARPALSIERLERAWSTPAQGLAERAANARAAADEAGIASVDPLARAALFDTRETSALERAHAAVLLAPGLPLAHAALAQAHWQAGAPAEALAAAREAVRLLPRHLDAWLWLGATGGVLLLVALAGGTLCFLVAQAIATARFAAHDLGDWLEPSMPRVARVALVAGLVLVPAALGEGLAGVALGCTALGLLAHGREQRIAVSTAAALFVAALHPVARWAGTRVAAVGADPVAQASWAAESGLVDAVDALRLVHATAEEGGRSADPLALEALAQWARRSEDLAVADRRYSALLEQAGPDPVVLNNAAGVKLALAQPADAIELYRSALEIEPSALLWFNLSQAHAASIDVEQHDRALAAAQSIDPIAVSELTTHLAGRPAAYAVELPLSQPRLRARLLATEGGLAAAELRRPLAPGLLGASPWLAIAAFAAAGGLALVLRGRFEASRGCLDCGAHLCRRCGTAPKGDGRCEPCQKRRFQGRAAAAWDARRARSLGERGAAALRWLGAGLVGRRVATGLPAAILAIAALAALLGHDAVLPDPGSVGAAGAFALTAVAGLALAAYLALAALHGLRARWSRS